MKKIVLIIFSLLLVCCITAKCIVNLQTYKYKIAAPMEDEDYKKAIVRDSHNLTYTLEALRPLMGQNELKKFIQDNNSNPEIYTPNQNNIKKGIFRANLHTHTTNSDGMVTVEKRLNDAQEYASHNIKKGYMVIAITDHNTVLGAKEVVKVLEKNKGKYDKIKVVLGIEINTEYHKSNYTNEPIPIHVLTWCINPYDKFLNKEFYKKDLNDKWNRIFPERDFDWVIKTMSNYGIVGPAHPARYTTFLKEKKYPYITEMLERYKTLNKNIPFTEGYYQSYPVTSTGPDLGDEYEKYINHINNECKRLNIIRTGSTDAHGNDIFSFNSF